MTKNTTTLFNNLNKICDENEAFYFSEQTVGDHIIRSYTYRLASYTDFQEPNALDCRGTAFIKDKDGDNWELFTRAYKKFFNLGEGIQTNDYINDYTPEYSFEKLDGSLILTGMIGDKIVAKSKTSVNSEQAQSANQLIAKNERLQKFISKEITEGRTPVFELVGPSNVVVLRYDEDELIYLGSVDMENSNVTSVTDTDEANEFPLNNGIKCAKIYVHTWDELLHIQETSEPIIEGFVVKTEHSFVKVKVNTYKHLHHLKDSVHNMKSLVYLILEDSLDDLLGAFQEDQATLDLIIATQEKVGHKFNHMVEEVKTLRNSYFNDFDADRKEFAIANKTNKVFPIVMKSINVNEEELEKFSETQVKTLLERMCKSQSLADTFVNSL